VLRNASPNFRELLKRDPKAEHFARAPKVGEVVRNPTLARTFRTLAAEGKQGFYTGRIASAIADVVKLCGGHLDLEDLKHHMDMGPHDADPMSIKLTGHGVGSSNATDTASHAGLELWEHPPNGQGIIALMALGILQELERTKMIASFSASDHNSTTYLHAVIESLRIAFADANWWVTDPHPDHSPNLQNPTDLISERYLAERAKLFSPKRASDPPAHGDPSPAQNSCDTVYFSVTDQEGNGISFINSVYSSFGSGIIPQGCGFTLQNRGANFRLGPADHPNIYAPRKRPYHTIIPALVTKDDAEERQLRYVYGVMGGFMQPQGHVQVLMNLEVFGMDEQQALDAPRLCIGSGIPEEGDVFDRTIYLEEGIPPQTVEGLQNLGHKVKVLRRFNAVFGRGQVIGCKRDEELGRWIYSAGSDPRGDGCATPA
jgi:gamma-glutamyltranspeptidase / glutathione hydrolase